MASGAATNKTVEQFGGVIFSPKNNVQSVAIGGKRRITIRLYASVIFVDPAV